MPFLTLFYIYKTIYNKIFIKFGASAIFTFAEAYVNSDLKVDTRVEREALLSVIQKEELEGVIDFLKTDKLALTNESELR